MKRTNSQKGQALILIAFGIVALVGFTALAVDGGRVLSDRRHAQNAADTAVLASALSKVNGANAATYKTNGTDRAASNGYTTGVNDRTVEVDLCSDVSGANACAGLPTGAVTSEYIRVRITSIVPMTFGRVLGRQTVTNVVEAIAHIGGSTSSGGGGLVNGSAMVATKGGDVSKCLDMNGNAVLNIHNSGIYINCSNSASIYMNSGAKLDMDAQGEVVGCSGGNLPYTLDPTTCGVNGGVSKTIEDDFDDVPKYPTPIPTCSGNGTVTGVSSSGTGPLYINVSSGQTAMLTPGNFDTINLTGGGTANFAPGNYCISNFNLSTGSAIGTSGTVRLIIPADINLNSGLTFDFNDLEIWSTNSSLVLNSGSKLLADRLRFYSTGGGYFRVNSAEVSSQDAYFYFHSGNIVWNSGSIITLHSPTTGEYAGLLVHKPYGNASQIDFNGSSNIHLTGTFLVPGSPIYFNSAVTFELHSQIIASTYLVNTNAGGSIDIYYQASENYGSPPPASPTIELTK